MKKITFLIITVFFGIKLFAFNSDSMKFKMSVRIGISDYQYGTSRKNDFALSQHRVVLYSTANPFAGFSYITENIFKNSCCDFFRVEVSASANRTKLITHFPIEQQPSVNGKPTFVYSNLALYYGWKIKERWRIAPFISFHYRTMDFIKDSDKSAISDFGIYDEKIGFTNNIKRTDFSLGGSFLFKITPHIFLQADLSYGFSPQIILPRLPKIYQAYPQLTAGYIFNNTHKQKS
jgi:hypothetical protein